MLNAKEAAAALGFTEGSLSVLRSRGTGCPFYRAEDYRVYYDERDIATYLKIGPGKRTKAPARMHTIRVMKNGDLHSIQRRAGETLQQAVDLLAMYPSFAGCTFKEAPEVEIEKGQRERLFLTFDKYAPQLRDAFVQSVTGKTPALQQAGANNAKKVFARIVREALK